MWKVSSKVIHVTGIGLHHGYMDNMMFSDLINVVPYALVTGWPLCVCV